MVDRRTGGLEISKALLVFLDEVDRRTGGLEIRAILKSAHTHS